MLLKTLESPLDSKEIQPVHPNGNQFWIFIRRTDAGDETLILWPPDVKKQTHLKRSWCWEWLKDREEGDDRGWYGWMASPTQWTWIWVGSRSWWWTGKPGILQSMGSQRVRHDWATELNWIELICLNAILSNYHTLSFFYQTQKSVLYVYISSPVLHVGSLIPSF